MAQDSFEFDYVPGYTKPTHEYGLPFGDEFHAERVAELLKSYHRFSQFGVTLAGGQGVVPTGCAIAQRTSDKKYYIYDAAATDGRQNCSGFLRDSRDTGTGTKGPGGAGGPTGTATSPAAKVATDCLGNIVVGGILDLTLLSGTDTTSLIAAAAGGVGSSAAGTGSGGGVYTQLRGRVDPATNYFYF